MSPPSSTAGWQPKYFWYRLFLGLVCLQLLFIFGAVYRTWTIVHSTSGSIANRKGSTFTNQQQAGSSVSVLGLLKPKHARASEATISNSVDLDPDSGSKEEEEKGDEGRKFKFRGPPKILEKHAREEAPTSRPVILVGNVTSLACSIPKLEPHPSSVRHLLQMNSSAFLGNCEGKYPLLFESGREESAIFPVKEEEGYDSCCYRTVERPTDLENMEAKWPNPEPLRNSSECFPLSFKTKTKIPDGHEFIAIYCKGNATNGTEQMVDAHAFVHLKPRSDLDSSLSSSEPSSSVKEEKEGGGKEKLNVVIFGLDSVSRMSFLRTMPKTYALLMEELGAVEMTGFNKIGEPTYPNLVALLTSKKKEELNGAKKLRNVDDFPFIWKEYSKEGYSTSYNEDDSNRSTFNFMMPGFNKPPTDHYLRPITHWSDQRIWFYDQASSCYGPRLTLQFLLNYMEKYVHVMSREKRNFFQFTWSTALTHNFLDRSLLADDPIHKSLKWLKSYGHLDKTVFILMSDHGLRFGKFRKTFQGHLEDLLPFAFILLPPSVKEKYKYARAYQNLVGNRDKLLTTLDLHETLKDILHLERIQQESLIKREADLERLGKRLPRGISRFLPIPSFRTCEMAEIPQKLCSCTLFKSVNVTRMWNMLPNMKEKRRRERRITSNLYAL